MNIEVWSTDNLPIINHIFNRQTLLIIIYNANVYYPTHLVYLAITLFNFDKSKSQNYWIRLDKISKCEFLQHNMFKSSMINLRNKLKTHYNNLKTKQQNLK